MIPRRLFEVWVDGEDWRFDLWDRFQHGDLVTEFGSQQAHCSLLFCGPGFGGNCIDEKGVCARSENAAVQIVDPVGEQRRTMARVHLADVRRLDGDLKANRTLIREAVVVSGTTVTDVYGVGPVVAVLLIGYTGGVGRFPRLTITPPTTGLHP